MASGVALLHRERQCEGGVSAGRRRQLDHRFYLVMALALSAGVFAGFTPSYYARSHSRLSEEFCTA